MDESNAKIALVVAKGNSHQEFHVTTIWAERAYQQHRRTTEKKKHQDELLRMEKGHEYLLEKEDKWYSQDMAKKVDALGVTTAREEACRDQYQQQKLAHRATIDKFRLQHKAEMRKMRADHSAELQLRKKKILQLQDDQVV